MCPPLLIGLPRDRKLPGFELSETRSHGGHRRQSESTRTAVRHGLRIVDCHQHLAKTKKQICT